MVVTDVADEKREYAFTGAERRDAPADTTTNPTGASGGRFTPPIQHIRETPVQPRLASRIVVVGLDHFIVDVRIVATEPGDLLSQARMGVGHELVIAALPQLVAVAQAPDYAVARRLDGVFPHQFRIQRRQLAVPVDDVTLAAGFAVVTWVE